MLEEDLALEGIIGIDGELSIPTVSWNDVFDTKVRQIPFRLLDDDLAYIMYTSGTTGFPKGIMHTHRSGLNYAKLSKDLYQVNSRDIVGNHSPLHFDISTFGFLTMPLAGGTTVIISEAHKSFPTSLSKLIENEKLSIWYSVPVALIQMLKRGMLEKRNLESLRWVLFGGEPFPVKQLRKLVEFLPRTTFSNVYGPAEVNQCTFHNFTKLPEDDSQIPLGQAWGNTEIIVLDENECEVKQGEIGELLVRTGTMMKGYWKQAKLTKKSFHKIERNPACPQVFFRTGDLVKKNVDGNLLFMGRKDRQIKFRGYRIELDEVESVLTANTKIDEAAVYVIKNELNEILILATVVPKHNVKVTEKDLQKEMKKYLPRYIELHKINVSKQLPRTSAGKVNHKELERQALEIID